MSGHGAPSFRRLTIEREKTDVLARNRTWSSTFAESRANPAHSEDDSLFSYPAGEWNSSNNFTKTVMLTMTPAGHACFATTGPGIEVAKFTPRPASRVARSGIEPDPAASEAAVRSNTPTSQIVEYPDLESNQNLDFRRVPCGPLHHQGSREPTAGFAPASSGLQDRRLAESSHVGIS